MTLLIDDISVTETDGMSRVELQEYVRLQKEKYPTLYMLEVKADGEFVELFAHTRKQPFERLRRVTGYLVGSLERWNDGKRAEERDRVKHTLEA